jgi:hypothetical protein
MHAPQPKPRTAWRSRARLAGILSWNSPDATTWLTADVSPLYLLKKATFIFLLAFSFGVVYPGVAAELTGVFSENDVKETMLSKHSDEHLQKKVRELNKFDQYKTSISKETEKIQTYIATLEITSENLTQIDGALSLYKALNNEKKENEAHPPIRISPFYMGSTMLLWPALYACLAWLIFIFPPPLKQESSKVIPIGTLLLLTLSIDVIYRSPTWFRNTPLGLVEGRISYGSNNIDIDPLGFFVQESLGLMVAFLVAIVWLKWSAYYRQINARLSATVDKDPITEALRPDISEDLAHMFLHWQIVSILLTLGFVWYTVFFWQMVIGNGDFRYLPHAIIVHSMWVVTWIIISLPLLVTSYQWHKIHGRAMVALAKMDLPKDYDPDRLAAALEKLQPISSWNIAASSIAVVVSLLVPFLKNVRH